MAMNLEAVRQAEMQRLLTLSGMDNTPSRQWARIPARPTENGIIRGFETALTLPDGSYVARLVLASEVVAVGEDNRVKENFSITLISDGQETVLGLNTEAGSNERRMAQNVWTRLTERVPRRPKR